MTPTSPEELKKKEPFDPVFRDIFFFLGGEDEKKKNDRTPFKVTKKVIKKKKRHKNTPTEGRNLLALKATNPYSPRFSWHFPWVSSWDTTSCGQATAEIHLCRGDTEPALRLLQEVRQPTNVPPLNEPPPLPVISRVITSLVGVITPIAHL